MCCPKGMVRPREGARWRVRHPNKQRWQPPSTQKYGGRWEEAMISVACPTASGKGDGARLCLQSKTTAHSSTCHAIRDGFASERSR